MLQLLQPIWMFTATAIAMPLVIHLWNLRKGKRLKIGSLLLINESIQPTARQVRITEWLLLLLRCLIILLLALFLSKPYWHTNTTYAKDKGWVMIPKESVSAIYPAFKKQVDSLIEAGHEFHYFNFPFEKASLTTTVTDSSDHNSYRKRLAQLNDRLPAAFPVYIFSDGSMDHFSGYLSATDLAVNWKLAPAQPAAIQLVRAYRFSADSLSLQFVSTSGEGNYFIRQYIPVSNTTKEIRVQEVNGLQTVQFQNGTPVEVDTAILRVTVYQKGYRDDAIYISSALEALRPLFGKTLQVTTATSAATITANQDWVFWLSDELAPSATNHTKYFAYSRGNMVSADTRIITQDNHTSLANPVLHKRITIQHTDSAQVIWHDGYGQPLLTKEPGKHLYSFYSRFNPSWSNLVWEASFPETLFGVLQPKTSHASFADNRQLDTAQLYMSAATPIQKNIAGSNTDLSAVCWWLLVICFAAERWLSLKNKTKTRAA